MVDWLERNRDRFTKMRIGAAWRQIYQGLAVAFPEDRIKINERLVGEAKARKEIPTGGAKITRFTGTPTKVVQGCTDCPGAVATVAENKPVRSVKMSDILKTDSPDQAAAETPAENLVDDPAGEPVAPEEPVFLSAQDILERFDGDPDMMIGFAKKKGIWVGKAIKPETIADRIFAHYDKKD